MRCVIELLDQLRVAVAQLYSFTPITADALHNIYDVELLYF